MQRQAQSDNPDRGKTEDGTYQDQAKRRAGMEHRE